MTYSILFTLSERTLEIPNGGADVSSYNIRLCQLQKGDMGCRVEFSVGTKLFDFARHCLENVTPATECLSMIARWKAVKPSLFIVAGDATRLPRVAIRLLRLDITSIKSSRGTPCATEDRIVGIEQSLPLCNWTYCRGWQVNVIEGPLNQQTEQRRTSSLISFGSVRKSVPTFQRE